MANVYAVKTGNWSDTTVWNTSALPTSADDVYSNNFTVTIDQNVTVLSISNRSASGITAGGGFTVSGNFTLNIANLFYINTVLTYTGTGTLNVVGDIPLQTGTNQNPCFNITGNGNVNFVGNVSGAENNTRTRITKSGTGKLTFTGNVSQSSSGVAIPAIINITNGDFELIGNVNTLISGALTATTSTIGFGSTGNCIITGQINNSSTSTGFINASVSITANGYFKLIGTMNNTSVLGVCYQNLQLSSISIATGPFISSPSAMLPFAAYRINYQITALSYFEFRDSSTNGALPPSAAAPATQMVAPDTIVDAPAESNVRYGTTYALGSQTGTLRVPSPNSVAFGVLTDNTTGTAVLTPQAVWDYATSSLTTSGSIGERLKNASTVDTTGDQLAALL
jgi:hypothetical protein